MLLSHGERRARLGDARLMLIFTPHLAEDPLGTLEAALPYVDIVQVRPKPSGAAVTPARASLDWTRRVLDLVGERALVLVNDRIDVALALAPEVDGVHLGADDTPPRVARELLGPDVLLGLSTHGARDIARAEDELLSYLGFGPIFPTKTKGYERGLGAEAAWIAMSAAPLPLFPIGGIDPSSAAELAPVGRAAVSSAILSADDPGEAARAVRQALG